MSKLANYNPAEPITEMMLMVGLKPPRNTSFTIWGEKGPGVLYWEDMFEIIDIRINGKPFHGLADSKIDIRFSFSNRPFKGRSLTERLMGVMPSYWADFFIGFEGHYCVFIDLDIARFEHISKCDTLIISSRDMRNDKGKPLRTPVNYATYTKESVTSVANIVTFSKYQPEAEGGGGKSKPKPSLQSYFESMPQQHSVFN